MDHLDGSDAPLQAEIVAVFGLGYVGRPLAMAMVDAGARVIGVDTDPSVLQSLTPGAMNPGRPGEADRFRATLIPEEARDAGVFLICVPTPNGGDGEPDMKPLLAVAESIGRILKVGDLVVCESTVYPGAMENLLAQALEKWSGLTCGIEFDLAYSPERIDPGVEAHAFGITPKLVAGMTPRALDRAIALYRHIAPVVPVSSIGVAEAAKHLENAFRLVNIALVNEFKAVLGPIGIDVWEVVAAAATKPFGFMQFSPGPGIGGHCIAIDPLQFAWAARQKGLSSPLIELAHRAARLEPGRVADRIEAEFLRRRASLHGARLLVAGVSYKRDVADIRESPALNLIDELLTRGASVDYTDPHVPDLDVSGHAPGYPTHSIEPHRKVGRDYDAIIITTDHDRFDWDTLLADATMVFDSRNAARGRAELGDRWVAV